MENYGIPGLTMAGVGPVEPPILLVIGAEKSGKSTLALSLFDWPGPGARPLVLAFDALGFDSIAQFAPCPGLKVKDQPGLTWVDKTNAAITSLENVFRSGRQTPFTSIVVDCASTMVDNFMQEANAKGARDPRQAFGYALNNSNIVLSRLQSLGKPLVWLAWLKPGFMEVSGSGQQKRQKMVLGGAQIEGSFRAKLTGKATQILYLEKQKQGQVQGADAEGYVRIFHTRTFDNIECSGRMSQYLPEPCPAHLGYVLQQLMQRQTLDQQQAVLQAQAVNGAQAPEQVHS